MSHSVFGLTAGDIQAIAFVVYDCLLIVGLLYAARQLREVKTTRNAESYLRAVDRLQQDDLRMDRRKVFSLTTTDHKQWSPDEFAAAERVAANFDVVGLAIRRGLFPASWILEPYRDTLSWNWDRLGLMVKAYQTDRGREFWISFEALSMAAKRFDTKIKWRKLEAELSANWEARKKNPAAPRVDNAPPNRPSTR